MEAPQTAPETATEPNIEGIVRAAAVKYGIDQDRFVQLIRCESSMNSAAINYGYYENGYPSGLGQHLSGYYPARAAKYGYSQDVLDPYSNANTTAAMIADGLGYMWECKL